MVDAHIVVGLAYGDEGKGAQVDHLCRKTGANLVVRFNGGPQAAHNVVCSDGKHHTFSQFGSGTFTGAKTYLSRYMLIEPFALVKEYEELAPKIGKSLLENVYIEEGSPVITPFHWRTQRLRAGVRGASCGMGIGELRADQEDNQHVITAGNLLDWTWNKRYTEICKIRDRKIEQVLAFNGNIDTLMEVPIYHLMYEYENFAKKVNIVPNGHLKTLINGPIVFEGAQGVLLDEDFGSAPFNTWTKTTFRNADKLLEGLGAKIHRHGIVRSYMTRHGAGPLISEVPGMQHPELHNVTGEWQGAFRQGYFDARAIRYAINTCGNVDSLTVTHMDRVGDSFIFVDGKYGRVFDYEPTWYTASNALDAISKNVGVEIRCAAYGPTSFERIDL